MERARSEVRSRDLTRAKTRKYSTCFDVDTVHVQTNIHRLSLNRGGPARATEILPITTYLESFKYFRLGSSSAVGILCLILTLIITGFTQSLLSEGG